MMFGSQSTFGNGSAPGRPGAAPPPYPVNNGRFVLPPQGQTASIGQPSAAPAPPHLRTPVQPQVSQKPDALSYLGNMFRQMGQDYSDVNRDEWNRLKDDFGPTVLATGHFLTHPSLDSFTDMEAKTVESSLSPQSLVDTASAPLTPIMGAAHAIFGPCDRWIGDKLYDAGVPVGRTRQEAAANVDTWAGLGGPVPWARCSLATMRRQAQCYRGLGGSRVAR